MDKDKRVSDYIDQLRRPMKHLPRGARPVYIGIDVRDRNKMPQCWSFDPVAVAVFCVQHNLTPSRIAAILIDGKWHKILQSGIPGEFLPGSDESTMRPKPTTAALLRHSEVKPNSNGDR